jgi:hypothetical protein
LTWNYSSLRNHFFVIFFSETLIHLLRRDLTGYRIQRRIRLIYKLHGTWRQTTSNDVGINEEWRFGRHLYRNWWKGVVLHPLLVLGIRCLVLLFYTPFSSLFHSTWSVNFFTGEQNIHIILFLLIFNEILSAM